MNLGCLGGDSCGDPADVSGRDEDALRKQG
jgi:hypothetical protein